MLLEDRIISFETLGSRLKNLTEEAHDELYLSAKNENAWFTADSVKRALDGIGLFLNKSDLEIWLKAYDFSQISPKKIGVIAAGNIPLVGFHDVLCVLMSGHHLMIKMSSKDGILMRYVLDTLFQIAPEFETQVTFVERLNEADAFIATGSDNTARYFEYYFKSKPHVIRKNRTSVAVLTGKETSADFEKLGHDIFQYYGLGCRNVSKVFVPKGYSFTPFLDGLKPFASIANHHKYRNNYDYNKSIYLVNREPHLDTEFLLIRASEELVSPISVLFYQEYTDTNELNDWLSGSAEKIQCVVGAAQGQVPFGEAQKPALADYADGVDTMAFLAGL
ncbi:acyl-CoA reductase [Reichenbachiella carrageenanivorans]|uniref:Acyl-CoA reductase n=1 Tax=Reichenbachiella carrageenanivorans TaxID=2979869 RepID=A0ABY6D590_9BACT|nr:acyl-CoA reductase [Reichenbachiella carrageenanivorans]UXX79010.1 acyl-CoA reductase [Reichenbachiella carrageenanivorans]